METAGLSRQDGVLRFAPRFEERREPGLRAEVDALLHEGQVRCMIVDLTEAGFLDSQAISLMVGLNARFKAAGLPLALLNPSPGAVKTLVMVHLIHTFTILAGEDELALFLDKAQAR